MNNRLRTYIDLRCKYGHEESRLYENIISGHGCKQCARRDHKKVCADRFLKYSKDDIRQTLDGLGYDWLNDIEYENAASLIKYQCRRCGHIATSNYTNILNGRRCRGCSIYKKKTTEEYAEFVHSTAPDYILVGEYVTCKDKTEFLHKRCGRVFLSTPDSFSSGTRCPFCSQSSMEQAVDAALNMAGIRYVAQKKFEDCVNIRELPFDFFLPDYNTCIECNGQQHYEPVEFFGGKDGFIKRQKNDTIKDDYCKKHEITLLKIPYWESRRIGEIIDGIGKATG